MKLRQIAHSRTGDKGDYSVISVICYEQKDYEKIRREVTPEAVAKAFDGIVKGKIDRYEVPKLGALIFNMEHALGGGVTRSLALDAHGKSLCNVMLEMELSDER